MNGESKGGLDPKKRKRKRKGKEGFLSYHVISMRGWGGGFFAFFPKPQPHLTHEQRKREEEEKKKKKWEEETIKVFEFAINYGE